MKIFVNKENAGWILDDIFEDYRKFTRHQLVGINDKPDIAWILNFWELRNLLGSIKSHIYITIHHIVGNKIQKYDFNLYNECVSGCIVPNKKTEEFLKQYLTIPIHRIPYWVLSKRMLGSRSDVEIKKQEFALVMKFLLVRFKKTVRVKRTNQNLKRDPMYFWTLLLN